MYTQGPSGSRTLIRLFRPNDRTLADPVLRPRAARDFSAVDLLPPRPAATLAAGGGPGGFAGPPGGVSGRIVGLVAQPVQSSHRSDDEGRIHR
jgi:hypothetical protein